jgi:hypothetical protein
MHNSVIEKDKELLAREICRTNLVDICGESWSVGSLYFPAVWNAVILTLTLRELEAADRTYRLL